jgi:hypothetical protein
MSNVVTPERMSSVFVLQAVLEKPLIYWNVDDYMQYCEPDELEVKDLAYDRVFLLVPGTIQDHDESNPVVEDRRDMLEEEFRAWVYPFMMPDGDQITGLFLHTNGTVPHRLAVLVKKYYEESEPAV